MLVSAKHHHESAIGIHMSPPSSHPISRLWVVIEHWCELPESHSKSHWPSILHMVVYMFPCYPLNSSHPLLAPLCLQVCALCLHLLCCRWGNIYFHFRLSLEGCVWVKSIKELRGKPDEFIYGSLKGQVIKKEVPFKLEAQLDSREREIYIYFIMLPLPY